MPLILPSLLQDLKLLTDEDILKIVGEVRKQLDWIERGNPQNDQEGLSGDQEGSCGLRSYQYPGYPITPPDYPEIKG